MSFRRWMQYGVSALVLSSAPMAMAGREADELNERLQNLRADIDNLAERARRIDRSATPGRGFITAEKAEERYQDYVFSHMIGEYGDAAEGFFALVTTAALDDAGLHSDAEWYLAESLYKLGNLRTAEANYRVILDASVHPFRDDAVRRLLELYVILGDEAAFDKLYLEEISSGRVVASDSINYAIGKAFFRKKNFNEAKTNLAKVEESSPWFRKAKYIIAASLVAEEDFDAAIPIFKDLLTLSIETQDDRTILDLSLLALGRIYLETRDYAQASNMYGQIGADSQYLSDKLFEEIWTYIKQMDEVREIRKDNKKELTQLDLELLFARERELVQQALRGIDLFLLAFSEHRYAPKLKLMQGHLHIQAVEYDDAMASYELVINEYSPVKDRFQELAESEDKPKQYISEFVEVGGQVAGTRDGLPGYAVAMVMADRDLARALTVYKDLNAQQLDVEASQLIIDELDEALSSPGGIGGFDQLRYDVQLIRSLGVQRAFDLVELELSIVAASMSGSEKKSLAQRGSEIAEAENSSLRAIAEGDPSVAVKSLSKLRDSYRALRTRVSDSSLRNMLSTVDRLHPVLTDTETVLSAAGTRLGPLEEREIQRIQKRFEREIQEVERQQAELETTLAEAQRVSEALTRAGFGRLEDFFAASVLRADVGIVDVYWAQKVEASEEKSRLIEERNDLKNRVTRQFELIEQKLRL